MPKKIIDPETGEEREMFEPEEVEAAKETAKTEAIEQYKIENPDKAGEITTLQTQLDDTKKELEKLQKKDLNFSNLREIKEGLETKLKELEIQIDGKVQAGLQTREIDSGINTLAAGDEEMKKKIKFHFEKTLSGVQPKTTEELNKKLQDAYLLATGQQIKTGPGGTILGSAGANFPRPKANNNPIKPEAVEVGKKLGLSVEDMKNPKYDKQDFSHTN